IQFQVSLNQETRSRKTHALPAVDLHIFIGWPRDRRDCIFPPTFDGLALVFVEPLHLLWNLSISRDLGRTKFG
ncbi:MAG: hypothetical protein WCD18_05240, partial [Thermosynechococcaceae cyanobacterium]